MGQGLVQSLGHPGGNFTGLSLQAVETTGKRLELLKELVPAASPVAVLRDRPSLPKSLGLAIPPSVLSRADVVMQ